MSEVMLSIYLPALASRIPGRQAKTLPTVRELMAAQAQGLQALMPIWHCANRSRNDGGLTPCWCPRPPSPRASRGPRCSSHNGSWSRRGTRYTPRPLPR